jgi:hypothetical protein
VHDGTVDNTGVPDDNPVNNTGVNANPVDKTGVDEVHTDIEAFVHKLESELDNEIDDSLYNPDGAKTDVELHNTVKPIDETEADDLRADATRQQAAADLLQSDNEDDDEPPPILQRNDDDSDEEDGDEPLPRLRRKRTPSYKHLKGRHGDGSLPTIARPQEFRTGKHHSYVILQSIIMTQYNLKQGIKKFGDKGKEAVLTELQQLYDRAVMEPV